MSQDPVKDYADDLGITVDELFEELDTIGDEDDNNVGLPGQQDEAA